MDVLTVPLLSDNYGYVVVDHATKEAGIVDPVEPQKMIDAAEAVGAKITCILTTHSHWDHAGGNEEAIKLLRSNEKHGTPPGSSNLTVYGGKNDRAQGANKILDNNDTFNIGDLKVTTYWTPCHTPGHVLYHVTGPEGTGSDISEAGTSGKYLQKDTVPAGESGALFTGDTLFIAGCGRFNSGSPEQMYYALVEIIAHLPKHTKVFVGHEYTKKNLAFAHSVEPHNQSVKNLMQWVEERRSAGKPTVPSTVQQEVATNPFIRLTSPEVVEYANRGGAITSAEKDQILDSSSSPESLKPLLVKIIAYLRQSKNQFGTGSK
eukprot:gb/GECG01009789.1/.p1 GENE.gb/GECG01009789.1/~~gb/GECG01009789.1/.p1  ORF type:complete len:319 (+),score=35.10 gb/GECG01009789.1/:1-957(+)